VDAALRRVAHELLDGDAHARGGEGRDVGVGREDAELPAGPAADALAYLRDRVGVPRDLPRPAARQLRAHLNWHIEGLEEGGNKE
jgi:glutathione S-transferase